MPVRLQPGHFYQSVAGDVWCCFRVNESKPMHAQADCIRIVGERVEYFYLDGRYDTAGISEHTLIDEVPAIRGYC